MTATDTLAARLELADWKHAARRALDEADSAFANGDWDTAREATYRVTDALVRCEHLASAFTEAA